MEDKMSELAKRLRLAFGDHVSVSYTFYGLRSGKDEKEWSIYIYPDTLEKFNRFEDLEIYSKGLLVKRGGENNEED